AKPPTRKGPEGRAMKQKTCPQCGKLFQAWRQKAYCNEKCRKSAQNARLGYVRRDGAIEVADSLKSENLIETNQKRARTFRRDEPFIWTACNEITRKCTSPGSSDAIAWTMLVEGRGWFGRIGKTFSFGPTSARRAEQAVEAKLQGQMFDKHEGEKSWAGDCWKLLSGA